MSEFHIINVRPFILNVLCIVLENDKGKSKILTRRGAFLKHFHNFENFFYQQADSGLKK